MSHAYSTSAPDATHHSGTGVAPAAGPAPRDGGAASSDRLSNLTQAIESIENRISSLMPHAHAAPAHAAPHAHATQQTPAVQQVAAPPLAPALPQAGPGAPPAADIGQLKTTISRLTDQINAQASQAVMARSAAQAVPARATAPNGAGGSLTSLAAQVAERKRALAREAEEQAQQQARHQAQEQARGHAREQAQEQAREQARNRAQHEAHARQAPAPQPAPQPGPERNAAQGQPHHQRPAPQPRIVARPAAPAPVEPAHAHQVPSGGAPGRGAPAHRDGALGDLSAKLDTIKTDLMGVKRSLARRPDEEASQRARTEQVHAQTQAEIERIASGIEALQAAPRFDAAGFDKLQDELGQLRQSMRSDLGQTVRNEVAPALEGAIAESLRGHDDRMGEAVQQLSRGLDAIGQATAEASSLSVREVMPKVEGLAAQFAELRGQVQDLPNTLTINRLEGKLREIAEAVEKVEPQEAAPSHFELEGFAQIESRLDEITRALVAVGMGAEARAFDPAEIDLSGLERLEGRMADLMGQIDQIGTAQAAAAQAAEQAAAAQTQAAAAQAAAAEAAEIEQVSQQLSALSERLVEIERHAETSSRAAAQALDHAPNFSALETQLSGLVQRLDDQSEADMSAHQLAALEGQLVQLAQAMDGMGRAQQVLGEGVRDMGRAQQAIQENVRDAALRETPAFDFAPLEARLAGIEDRIDVGMAAPAADLSPLEARLAGIEDRIDAGLSSGASGDPAAGAQAQRQIALQAAQAAAAQVAEVMGAGHDADMLTELSRDMHAVQEALVKGDHRNAETFEAVRRTLDAVGDRLATIEHGLTTFSAAPAPTMPPAAQLSTPSVAESAPGAEPAPVRPASFAQGFAADAPSFAADAPGFAADAPIEPNIAGAPDIDDIVRRATERLNVSTAVEDPGYAEPRVADAGADGDAPTDVVAAARRAVQATRAELDAVAVENGGLNLSDAAGGLAQRIRKPLVALAAAVALAVVAFGGWHLTRGDDPADERISVAKATLETGMARDRADKDAPEVRAVASQRVVARQMPDVMPPALDEPASNGPALGEPFGKPVTERVPSLAATRAASRDVPGVDEAFDPATLPDGPADTPSVAPISGGAPIERVPAAADTPVDLAAAPPLAGSQPVSPSEAVPAAPAAPQAVTEPVPAGIGEPALRKAAASGDRLALHEVGTRLSEGRGTPKDLGAAAKWFSMSAERGFAPAEYALGSLHEKGLGVPRDIPRAVELYKSAAAKGNARAMHNLAVIQAMGALGQADMPNATRWFHEAASLGVKDSQFNLGILYGQGMGVPQNLAESYKWFSIAAGSGDADAASKRDEVAGVMDAETLKRAKGLVADWKAALPTASANAVTIPAAWGAPKPMPQRAATAAPKPPKPAAVPVAMVKRAQGLLNRIGYEIGRPDGKIGPRTRSALASFQRTWSLPATGKLDKTTLDALEDANT